MIIYRNYGGASGITGATHMISVSGFNILLDCGLFQGKDIKRYSNNELHFNPEEVNAIVLSHAHIDHCGRIPALYNLGYKGNTYGTKATRLLSEVLLHENFRLSNNHLFNEDDIGAYLKSYVDVSYGEPTSIGEGVWAELYDSGHLLGSASILLTIRNKKIFYSGDIGKTNTPILKDPDVICEADYMIFESTYGHIDSHDSNEFFSEFEEIIIKTLKNGGKCLIPAATVGKMQESIYLINEIFEKYRFDYKVYVDSPMSKKITDIYEECTNLYDDEAKDMMNKGDNPLYFKTLSYVYTKEESIDIQNNDEPCIVLAGGGMCESGRVIYHLRNQISSPNNSIILIGNQMKGTIGFKLISGIKNIDIFGNNFKVRAKIYNFPSLSGHSDCNGLVNYVNSMKIKPKKIFLVHGDRSGQIHLSKRLKGIDVEYTEYLGEYEL